MNRTTRAVLASLAASALATALSACGGDDGGDDADEPDAPATSDGTGSESDTPDEPAEPAEPEAAGTIWVTSSDAGKVYEVDAATDALVRTIDAADLYPFDVETGFDAAWVVNGYGGVTRIDPVTGQGTDIELPAAPGGLVVGDDAVWVATVDGDLLSIDPASNEAGEPLALGEEVTPDPLLWVDGTVVAANSYDASVVVIDPTSGVTATTPRDDVVFRGVVDDGTAWFSGFGGVFAYDTTGAEVQAFPSDSEVTAVAAAPDSDAMWVGYSDGTVATLDGATGEYGTPVAVGDTYVGDLQYADGVLWASIEGGSLYRLDPATLDVQAEVALPDAEGQASIAIG